MSDVTETPEPEAPAAETPEAETGPASPAPDEGGTGALDRAAESIHDAKDAEGAVAANDDITTRDADRAGDYSEDPDGSGGHP